MTFIERSFYKVTGKTHNMIELDDHLLVRKGSIKLSIGDRIKKGDIITSYMIDDGKNLLESVSVKEFNANKYPDISKKKRQTFKMEEVV
jgi:hypothetical protein